MVARRKNPARGKNLSKTEHHIVGSSSCGSDDMVPDSMDNRENAPGIVKVKTEPRNPVEWRNTFHMRQMTLSSIASSAGQFRQTLSSQAAGANLGGRYMMSARRSLDLLRMNIQSLINKEIDAVLKKYLEKFFQPAIKNIRNNLGEHSVTEESIRIVCRQILEDAKIQYYSGSQSRSSSPYSDCETPTFGDIKFGRPAANSPFPVGSFKRKESDTDSEASQSAMKTRKKVVRTVPTTVSSCPVPVKMMKFDNIRREGPKWDPNRIVKSTLFIMGARANKVLGFGQTRGRLYTKHPELLKYSGDAEDKEWLARHNLMPPTGGIAYLLLLEDVKELAESEEYRHNPNVLLHDLRGFEAPDFMLKKIRAFVSQARTDGKQQMNPNLYNDNKEKRSSGRINYTMDCASVIVSPPATVLASAPAALCGPLNIIDRPSSLLTSARPSNYLSSLGQNFVYDSITYCGGNRTSQTIIYTSTTTMSSSIVNVNNHPTLASLLMSPPNNQNRPQPME